MYIFSLILQTRAFLAAEPAGGALTLCLADAKWMKTLQVSCRERGGDPCKLPNPVRGVVLVTKSSLRRGILTPICERYRDAEMHISCAHSWVLCRPYTDARLSLHILHHATY